MKKIMLTNARISKPYGENKPVISVNEDGTYATFGVGVSEKFKDAEGNAKTEYLNFRVKISDKSKERIKRILNMKLTAGSVVNIVGELTVERYTTKEGKEVKNQDVFWLESIEYAGIKQSSEGAPAKQQSPAPAARPQQSYAPAPQNDWADMPETVEYPDPSGDSYPFQF